MKFTIFKTFIMDYSKVNLTLEDFYNFTDSDLSLTTVPASILSLNDTTKYKFKSGTKSSLYEIEDWVAGLLYFAYSSICATSLMGNLVVLWLVLPVKRMWSLTNFFIANLAVADLIIAIFTIPFHFQAALKQRWDLPEILCSICPFVQALSVDVSVLTLSAIAIHRYKAVMKPFHAESSKGKALVTIMLIWLLSVAHSIPTFMDFKLVNYIHRDGSFTPYCRNARWLSPTLFAVYNQSLVFIQYVVPVLIITLAYVRMGIHLWKRETPGNMDQSRDAILLRNKKKVTKMLAVVVLMFGICWFPFQMYNFLQTVLPSINNFRYINVIWFCIHWLAMSNSCCNPFIYAIYNEKFKEEFKRRTISCFGKSKRRNTLSIRTVSTN